jgi:ribosomal protein L37AE/L43A
VICPDCLHATVGLDAGVWSCHRQRCTFEAKAGAFFSDQMVRLRLANLANVETINVESANSVWWNR